MLTTNGSIYFKAEPLNNYFNENTEKIHYYVHLQGSSLPETSQKENSIPLNLSVVIDKSGSMDGQKLEYAKEALKYIITNLNKNDYLSSFINKIRLKIKINYLLKSMK